MKPKRKGQSYKEYLLGLIAINRDTKAPGWRGIAKKCIRKLELLEDPYGEHEDVGNEMRGRKPLPPHMSFSLPCWEDNYDDESDP